ncbi:MAG TPA: hypothetical protein VFV34_07250, partial [Blastocatellia bacterium]|nr:hypothetical protein [Blastocatellia bacterium]
NSTLQDPTDTLDGQTAVGIGGVVGIFEKGACPLTAPFRVFDVTAAQARDILPVNPALGIRSLVYNSRQTPVNSVFGQPPDSHTGPLHDPTAIMYVRTRDLVADSQGVKRLRSDLKAEPLVLRANAGDCIAVILRNKLPNTPLRNDAGWDTLPLLFDDLGGNLRPFNTNQIVPSPYVGLHPQLLTYNAHRSDGNNIGFNRVSTVAPNGIGLYLWYAGTMNAAANGSVTFTPVEFGGTNLIPSDRIKHPNKGAIGSLIIEPPGSTYLDDTFNDPTDLLAKKTRASATITPGTGGSFREFVLMHQTNINFQYKDGTAVRNLAGEDDPEDSGQRAFNYRSEPLWFRMGHVPQTPLEATRELIWTNVLSNSKIGNLDPETPIFVASRGAAVRFRVLDPGGHGRNNVFALHGHIWEEEPWNSTGTVQAANPISEWKGAQFGIGSTFHDNFLLKNGAGGKGLVVGDYLFRTFQSTQFDNGLWGIFRVLTLTKTAADGSLVIE